MKDRGGWLLEQGVHTSDLTLYLMGDVERVFAETHLWERTIKIARPEQPTELYAHRVREEIEEADTVEATAEDTGLPGPDEVSGSTRRPPGSGAIGQTTFSDAAPGEQSSAHVIYGSDRVSEGSLRLPGFRAGRPVQVAGHDPRRRAVATGRAERPDEAGPRGCFGKSRAMGWVVESVERWKSDGV